MISGPASRGIRVFLLLSLVSFFADFTYEGARSVSGPVLEALGASLLVTSTLSIGEAISYTARLVSGVVTYKKAGPRTYWGLVFLGYALNLVVVPLIALAWDWRIALLLYILERTGKGLRVPPRDAILAEVGASLGLGRLYGIHELLDQAGAVSGALFIGLLARGGVRKPLELLAIPALAALLLLTIVYAMYPRPRSAEKPSASFREAVWRALALSMVLAASAAVFVHWSTASYLLSRRMGANAIALLYAVAMLSDALAAIPLGMAYDRLGKASLAILPLASFIATLSLFTLNPLVFSILWGVAMSGYETIAKAYIAGSVEPRERGLAFGTAYTIIGVGWTLGNIALALLVA